MSDRFKPTRAGVINVWDYVDEEWAFADGRLALRGHNGSGKTRALEALFPFILDGENPAMKSSLLYRGQESGYGYVWMEFCRDCGPGGPGRPGGPARTVTLIIGMRAHRDSGGVRMSFYVTARRVGADFGLLSAGSRPLTERQLRAVLEPGAWRRTAAGYRDLVDARLFGLGRERYAQLLGLLLALRRPLPAAGLDPAKVPDALTRGLSPVDGDLVARAARDFGNLAAVRGLSGDLTAASAAAGEFTAHYAAYLRAHVRHALDRIAARSGAVAGHAGELAAAAAARRRAVAAEQAAGAARDAAAAEGKTQRDRLDGLRNSAEYRARDRIGDRRREVACRAGEIAAQRGRLSRDRQRIGDLAGEVAALTRRVADSRAVAGRHAAALADAAQRSGITGDGFGPAAPGAPGPGAPGPGAPGPGAPGPGSPGSGDDLLTIARARLAARWDDITAIRQLLAADRDARLRRACAEQELSRVETAGQRQREEAEAAAARLAGSRAAAVASLTAWTARWASPGPGPAGPVTPAGAAVLAGALDLAGEPGEPGEPGAPGLTEVYDGLVADRQAAAFAGHARRGTALDEARRRLADLRAERDIIAAGHDDAPPGSDPRPASHGGRPGAPLWQLVRFAPDVPARTAAAIEGALDGAGLLTAWVHPDPALTRAALDAAEAGGYLVAGSAPGAPGSLADILLPEDQEHVPVSVIVTLLRSIALTDEIMAPGSDIPARPVSRGIDYVFGDAPAPAGSGQPCFPAISTRAQFSYGVHVGARPREAPGYIGAANRARRRRARLASQDALIAGAAAECGAAEAGLAAAGERLADFHRARAELPATHPVAAAAVQAGRQAALLARSRDEAGAARHALDAAIAQTRASSRQLRQAAAERAMPVTDADVDAVVRAAAEFGQAAAALHAGRVMLAQAEEDLAGRTGTLSRHRRELAGAEAALADAERLQEAREEEFRVMEEALRHGARSVLERIRQTERLIRAAEQAYGEHDRRARAEHDQATAAGAQVRAARGALTSAIAQLYEEAARFGDLAGPDLRPVLGVTTAVPWPGPASWPPPGAASDTLTDMLAGDDPAGSGDVPVPESVLLAVLPPGAAGVLDAFATAVKGGHDDTDIALKSTAERMSAALQDFTDALAACGQDYRVDWEPGAAVAVHVTDGEGRTPVARFAARVAERAADQAILLEERERAVLADELLAALAAQIHARVSSARDLTRGMNAGIRSRPMSSGLAIGIRWVRSAEISDAQRAASRLLDRDSPGPEHLAELRGILRDMIRGYHAAHPRATDREALAAVVDYRSWYAFELLLVTAGEGEQRLTQTRYSVMSGGEKAAAIYLPLFAAASALYSSAKPDCPRLIAMDEAFAGIDERYKPDLFGLMVAFDLDLFMTGHDLWVTTGTVPMIAHYDLCHDKVTRTTSALLILWDGTQLIDAGAGFPDNEALAAGLLGGLRPTRHAPPGAGGHGAVLSAPDVTVRT